MLRVKHGSKGLSFKIAYNKLTFANVVSVVLPFIVWLLLSSSTCRLDTVGYQNVFYDSSGKNTYGIEIGFYYLVVLARKMGMNYWVFRSCVFGIAIINISIAIVKLETDPRLFWLLYSIFPLLYDAIQIRFFLGFSFSILAIAEMISCNNVKSKLKIIFLLILSVLSHSSFLLFIIYLIPLWGDRRVFKRIMSIIGVVEVLSFVLINRFSSYILKFIMFFRNQVDYYRFELDPITFLQFIVMYLLLLFLYFSSIRVGVNYSFEENEIIFLKKKICITSIPLVGLVMLNTNFSRYFRTSIVILALFTMKKTRIKEKKELISKIIIILILVFLAYYFYKGYIWQAWKESFMQIKSFSKLRSMY